VADAVHQGRLDDLGHGPANGIDHNGQGNDQQGAGLGLDQQVIGRRLQQLDQQAIVSTPTEHLQHLHVEKTVKLMPKKFKIR
jgi:hypothetical protein